MREITATAAARGFSRLLDEVEHGHESFRIRRGGRVIAVVGPSAPPTITVRELLARLAALPRPDDRFSADIDAARAALGGPPDLSE